MEGTENDTKALGYLKLWKKMILGKELAEDKLSGFTKMNTVQP